MYQLGKIRKYITADITNVIYKQTIIPLFDYADFLIESGQKYYLYRLDVLHEKALRIIDCKKHHQLECGGLEILYRLTSPSARRREHHCAIMYRFSKLKGYLDLYRPKINLRSRNKVKFRLFKSSLKQIEKSPMNRGVKLWNLIPENIQKSVTKVKFKTGIKTVRLIGKDQ